MLVRYKYVLVEYMGQLKLTPFAIILLIRLGIGSSRQIIMILDLAFSLNGANPRRTKCKFKWFVIAKRTMKKTTKVCICAKCV